MASDETYTETRQHILLVDDDTDLLEMLREILGQLPSRPEIHTASSGSRAMAILDTHPIRVMICDLKMPKMDGLQLLTVVRRKFPQLRTVAVTSIDDEQYRSRVYGLGVDQFWNKPGTEQEIKMFLECIESLLGSDNEAGFRGVQSKSLVDIIQLECISQSSSVLRIINGAVAGRIWINEGEVVDAEAGELRGEQAFQKILGWKSGAFETLPSEASRPRTIFTSYNALLLTSAQALDEAQGNDSSRAAARHAGPDLSQFGGIEFVLAMKGNNGAQPVARGLENPQDMAEWAKDSLERFRALGERLQVGELNQIEGLGPHRNVTLATNDETEFCVGWRQSMTLEEMREMNKKVLSLWVS